MKKLHFLLPILCATAPPLLAQVTVVTPAPGVSPVVVVRTLNPVVVQRQLSLAPKVVILSPAPQTEVKTTKTTTVVDTPGQPACTTQSAAWLWSKTRAKAASCLM